MLAFRASGTARALTVYVATSLENVEETRHVSTTSLAVGGPLLLLLVGVTCWVVAGRALRPVEAIRAEVADITDHSLDRRVSVPATPTR